ncbi:hypothetical protein HHI36_022463 [Cryptolaemus montrouzieri]|uniref:Uncharacterized protein n=1 Tax=Cryptolaemus montrouzieri TaxID=559131 RepID=A0ABD2MZU8_9CUCU
MRRLRNNPLELELSIDSLNAEPDVLCLTEHWLVEEKLDFIRVENYRMVSCFSRESTVLGGSCILVKKGDRDFQEDTAIREMSIESEIEVFCVTNTTGKLVILCAYRTGLEDFKTFISGMDRVLGALFNKFHNYRVRRRAKRSSFTVVWITRGIRVYCKNKRDLYEWVRSGWVSEEYYKKYVKILKQVIEKAKIISNQSFMSGAKNRVKATWSLIKQITDQKDRNAHPLFHSFPDRAEKDQLNEDNSFFVNICPDVDKINSMHSTNIKVCAFSLFFEPKVQQNIVK